MNKDIRATRSFLQKQVTRLLTFYQLKFVFIMADIFQENNKNNNNSIETNLLVDKFFNA